MSVIRDLFAHRRTPRTAFVCGGGGNLGAIQVGMLRALLDRRIVPDVLVGCSVGALNAAAVAADPTPSGAKTLWDAWSALRSDDVFHQPSRLAGPWQLVRRRDAVYSNAGLERLISRWLPFQRLEEAPIPLHVVATSLVSRRERWFASGPVGPVLMASAALPAVFPPVMIDGEPFIDGGVVDNVPVSRAIELGARRIYVLHVGNFARQREVPQRPLDVLVQAFSIARSYRFHSDLERVPDGVELITLPAIDPGPLRYTDLSRSRELMARGYRATAEFLDGAAVTAR